MSKKKKTKTMRAGVRAAKTTARATATTNKPRRAAVQAKAPRSNPRPYPYEVARIVAVREAAAVIEGVAWSGAVPEQRAKWLEWANACTETNCGWREYAVAQAFKRAARMDAEHAEQSARDE